MDRSAKVVGCWCLMTQLLSACSSLPTHHRTGWHADYPTARYFTGLGQSSKSANAAYKAARTAVIEQLSTHIQSVCVDKQHTIIRAETQAYASSTLCRTVAKTQYSHANMIKAVPRLGAYQNGVYYAFAVLNRNDAAHSARQARAAAERSTKMLLAQATHALANKTLTGRLLYDLRKAFSRYQATTVALTAFRPNSNNGGEIVDQFNRLQEAVRSAFRRPTIALRLSDPAEITALTAVIAAINGAATTTRDADVVLRLQPNKALAECNVMRANCCYIEPTFELCQSNRQACVDVHLPRVGQCHPMSISAAKRAAYKAFASDPGVHDELAQAISQHTLLP
jgi:hypothetical protein